MNLYVKNNFLTTIIQKINKRKLKISHAYKEYKNDQNTFII